MNEKTLDTHFEDIRQTLLKNLKTSKIIKHPGTVGSIRELFIREFLQSHLPDNLRITSGEIFDSKDAFSKQQDLVLYRANFPKIGMSKADLLFVEGVLATIEVKSRLDNSNIGRVLENVYSVKKLQKSILGSIGIGVTHNFPLTKILAVVFSYQGSNLDKIEDAIGNSEYFDKGIEMLPDMVIVLNRGILIKNSGELLAKDDKDIDELYLKDKENSNSLKMLFLKLTEISGTFSNVMVNWNDY